MSIPLVTVVMATWNRGRHILPSVQSVLAQNFTNLELLVIGDGCTDDTANVLATVPDKRLRWINLNRNCGSQSFPNNAGIAAARGEYIAYIGHDDVWAPHHLADQLAVMQSRAGPDFAIAGAILYGPPGSADVYVTGLFDNKDAAEGNFFPPTSLMHRRDVIKRIGLWRAPWRCPTGVDAELQLRAWKSGMHFESTHRVSAHKFIAAQRYLSYIALSSTEQEECLNLTPRTLNERTTAAIAAAKAQKRFMTFENVNTAFTSNGDLWRWTRKVRGIDVPPTTPVQGSVIIPQDNAPRGLDWNIFDSRGLFRWAGPSPRPRLLVPCCFDGACRIQIEVFALATVTGQSLKVILNDHPVRHSLVQRGSNWFLQFEGHLKPAGPSVIEFFAPPDPQTGPDRSFALGNMEVAPL